MENYKIKVFNLITIQTLMCLLECAAVKKFCLWLSKVSTFPCGGVYCTRFTCTLNMCKVYMHFRSLLFLLKAFVRSEKVLIPQPSYIYNPTKLATKPF